MNKIAIIGASGFLGSKLKNILEETCAVIGTYQNKKQEGLYKLDITNNASVNAFISQENSSTIIHTAAISDPDECELNKDLVEKINHVGTKNIVDACRKKGSRLIYISTAYVFDGRKGNYGEEDQCNPVNFYGETKLSAEQEVLTLSNSMILRFDILYGFNCITGNNGFFSKIIKGAGVEVNNDQNRQPLLVDDVGYAIKILIERNYSGIYHLAGQENITKHALGLALEKIVRYKSELVPIHEKQQIARRPKDVSLNTSKAISMGIKFHSISEGIEIVTHQYKERFI